MTMIKLIATDLDNTLLDKTGRIPETTAALLRQAAENGVLTAVATGRCFPSALEHARTIGARTPVICYNGSLIKWGDTGEIIAQSRIDTDAIRQVATFCRREGLYLQCYDFVVPPLEGFWWQEGEEGVNYADKSTFHWISVIRLPDFVTKAEFDWAVQEAAKKKKLDCSAAEFLTIDEGLCVQILHLGPFDDEPVTVAVMDGYLEEMGYENDFSGGRLHHEIYLSDARKVAPEKWKTVIRHPIRKK